MIRPIAFAALLAPLAACDALDTPQREPWSPDFTERAVEAAPETLAPAPADCGQITRWAYDYTDGKRTRAQRFSERNVPDRTEERTYDDAGRIVRAYAEWDGGWVEVTLERDPDGRVVRRVVDGSETSTRSTAEVIERGPTREVLRYDGTVLLLEPYDPMTDRRTDHAARADIHDPLVDGDAMIDALVREIEAGRDIDPLFDPFEVVETRLFDGEGHPLRTEWDLDGDGVPEQTRDWTRTALPDGVEVEITDDYDADGAAERGRVELYDGQGRLTFEGFDLDGDRQIDRQRTLVYEGDALVSELAAEVAGDGATTTQVITYEYVERARIARIDDEDDGVIDHITTVWLRDDGQRVLKQEDDKADGEIDWQRRHVFDTEGREIYSERDRDVDGVADLRWDYGWSAEGLLLHAVGTEPGSARCGGLRD